MLPAMTFPPESPPLPGLVGGVHQWQGLIEEYREFLPVDENTPVITLQEGATPLVHAPRISERVGADVWLKVEGANPTGSFKDRGMTVGVSHAKSLGATIVACASTGNTSASLAMFASLAQMQGIVFIGSGKISFGKLSQALDYGALTLQIQGDFDACLRRVRQIAVDVPQLGIYLMNSVNPFRLEGQKAIMLRVLEALRWRVPDWIVVPGGNLGNVSSFGKAFAELADLGLIEWLDPERLSPAAISEWLERPSPAAR